MSVRPIRAVMSLALVTALGCFASNEPLVPRECRPACGATEFCIEGECRPQCAVSFDCARGQACRDGACIDYEGARCGDGDSCLEGFWCDAGLCRALSRVGEACSADVQCDRGECTDGVCCERACDGACAACSAALTGGLDGQCLATGYGLDPRDECPGVTTCDGLGGCTLALGASCGANTECQSGACVDGVCCESACDGVCESCSAALNGEEDGRCSNTVEGLERADECVGATACAGDGACHGKALGELCSADYECSSGACADGVCCESACTGSCERCNAAGSCVGVINADDPDTCGPAASSGDCPAGGLCTCDGSASCKASGNAPCSVDGDCATGNCYEVPQTSPVVKFCCDRACDGPCETCGSNGQCVPIPAGQAPEKGSCPGAALCDGSGLCNDSANGAACANDFECVSGVCDGASGVCCNEACGGSACFTCDGSGGPGQCVFVSGDPGNICPGDAVCGDPSSGNGCWAKQGGETCASNGECVSGECCNGHCLFGWQEVPTPTTENLNDVYVASATAAWAVGDNGTLLEWDGSVWRAIATGTSVDLEVIEGHGDDLILTVGADGELLRYANGSWAAAPSPPSPASSVYVADPNDAYAVGKTGELEGFFGRLTGDTWTTISQGPFIGIAGLNSTIFVAFANPVSSGIIRFSGDNQQESANIASWNRGAVVSTSTFYGVGTFQGFFLLYEPNSSVALTNTFGVLDVAAVETSVVGVSPSGDVARYDNNQWSLVVALDRAVSAIDAVSECSIVVVGDGGVAIHR